MDVRNDLIFDRAAFADILPERAALIGFEALLLLADGIRLNRSLTT